MFFLLLWAFYTLVGIASVGMYMVYNRYTYLWEHTTLAEAVNTVRYQLTNTTSRTDCVLPQFSNANASVQGNDGAFAMDKKLKIGLIMMYESTDNITKAWSEELLQPLIRNRQSYCDKHGYTLLDSNHLLDYSRAASWSKLLALEHYFSEEHYDYLFYVDMDVIIMNPEIKLEHFIDASARKFDILITEDDNGVNAGVFMARNSAWTLWFLRTAWKLEELVPSASPEGVPYPFRWEQRAFHYMINSRFWQDSVPKLPTYPGDYMEVRSHFYTLPQCAFNSYIAHPLDFRIDFDTYSIEYPSEHYAEGDFLIHFAGKRGEYKHLLMQYYLEKLEQQERHGALKDDSSIVSIVKQLLSQVDIVDAYKAGWDGFKKLAAGSSGYNELLSGSAFPSASTVSGGMVANDSRRTRALGQQQKRYHINLHNQYQQQQQQRRRASQLRTRSITNNDVH